MTRRSKWLAVAWLFTLINLAGAIYVARSGGVEHLVTHVALAVLSGYFVWRLTSRPKEQQLAAGESPVDERLDRIEQSVDTIAIEVERIGEAQRFITKLAAGEAKSSSLKPQP